MFTIAHLVKVHHDLWPWMTFRGHLKVMNVKIANIFLLVRDKDVVTMKHLWEVDIGLSESITKFDPGWPWRRYFKVTKVKIESGVLTFAPRPMLWCLLTKMFTISHLLEVRHDLWPWVTLMGHLKVTKRAVHPSNCWASCSLSLDCCVRSRRRAFFDACSTSKVFAR